MFKIRMNLFANRVVDSDPSDAITVDVDRPMAGDINLSKLPKLLDKLQPGHIQSLVSSRGKLEGGLDFAKFLSRKKVLSSLLDVTKLEQKLKALFAQNFDPTLEKEKRPLSSKALEHLKKQS